MVRRATPITDALEAVHASLNGCAQAAPDAAEVRRAAERIAALARHTAPLERFYAEVTADAAEDELLQRVPRWHGTPFGRRLTQQ